MSDDSFLVDPKRLGDILTPEVFADIIANDSCLTGEPLLKVWRRMEMQGEPPDRIRIEVSRRDADRLIAEIKREQKLIRRALRAKGGTA